jgi:hypothetical protein
MPAILPPPKQWKNKTCRGCTDPQGEVLRFQIERLVPWVGVAPRAASEYTQVIDFT